MLHKTEGGKMLNSFLEVVEMVTLNLTHEGVEEAITLSRTSVIEL